MTATAATGERAPMFTLREAFDWLDEGVLSGRGDEPVCAVTTDSRRCRAGDLFVALRGDRFDGHDFVADVVASGVRAVMIERGTAALARPARGPAAALVVADTRRAFGRIAGGWRRRFGLPLIAVTGSNGKTTVKEMIAAVLREHAGEAAAFATRGNLNNDVGVPQTLLALGEAHRVGVVELGMNHPGEIAWLAEIVRPTVALVNNAQREHQEFLAGPQATAHENGAVLAALPPDGTAVFPGDDDCAPIWQALAGGRRVVSFGLDPRFTVAADPMAIPARFEATIGSDRVTVTLSIAGRHNVRNALAAAACCHAIGVPAATIAAGLGRFMPAPGRLQQRPAHGGAVLIDDSYNANPDSVRAAIDLLADEPPPRLLILGDMGEVGADGPAFHHEVGDHARRRGLDGLVAVGEACAEAARGFGATARHFASVEALLDALDADRRAGQSAVLGGARTILVKGSRFMRMERVVRVLAADPSGAAVH